jgi:putative ABC transport system permease protein
MSILLQDLRFALRSFVRAPRFSVPAILALALGIGATSATLSVVRGVMLEPLPYRDPDRVVSIWETNPDRNIRRNVIGQSNFVAWRERLRSFEHLGMVSPARLSLIVGNMPDEVEGMIASSDVFAALGVQPALGRAYTANEDVQGNAQVMVVSHEFWRTRLGGRADIVGSTIRANGVPRTILGVMPQGFTLEGQKASFLIPYGWVFENLRTAQGRGTSHGIARLRDGVTLEQARTEMRQLMAVRETEDPRLNTRWTAVLVPVHEQMVEQIRPALLILTGAVALVLLIACVNVANLLLARSTVRRRELGIRAALGARRRRLLAQLLSESLVLGAVGGVAGVTLAFAFHRGLLALVADRIPVPRLDQVSLDVPMLALTMAIALATGVLFGFVPALVTSGSVDETLRDGGRHGSGHRSRRLLAGLVIAEVALSLVLLAGAGLLIRSFIRLQNIDPGFRADGVLTARVADARRAVPNTGRPRQFLQQCAGAHQCPPWCRAGGRHHISPHGARTRHEDRILAERSAAAGSGRRLLSRCAADHAWLLQDHGHSGGGRSRLHGRGSDRVAARHDRERDGGTPRVSRRGSDRQTHRRVHRRPWSAVRDRRHRQGHQGRVTRR